MALIFLQGKNIRFFWVKFSPLESTSYKNPFYRFYSFAIMHSVPLLHKILTSCLNPTNQLQNLLFRGRNVTKDLQKTEHKPCSRPTSELIPYANNSRLHSDSQVKQIASSIKEFGFTNPVIIDEQNGIIAGHGRVMAAEKLGIEEVPCVQVFGWTEAQKKAYVIADNQLPMNADWDMDMLRLEVQNLQEMDFDLPTLGFDGDVLDKLLDIDSDLPELPTGRDPFQQKSFFLHDEQVDTVDDAVLLARTNPLADTGLNENANGNALALICMEWLAMKDSQKKDSK